MLYIVVRAVDEVSDDVIATLESIPKQLREKVGALVWKPELDRGATTEELCRVLSEAEVRSSDYVMIVRPGTLMNKKLLRELALSKRWTGRSSRIRLVEPGDDPHWIGVAPIAVKYELLQSLDFSFGKFTQDDRCRYFLETLRHEGWYDVVAEKVVLTNDDRIDFLKQDSPQLYEKEWYFDFNKQWYKLLKRYEEVPRIAQLAYVYMLQYRLTHNANNSNKYVLKGQQLRDFYDAVAKNFAFIDDDVLMGAPTTIIRLDRNVRLYLLTLKNPAAEPAYEYEEGNVYRRINDVPVDSAGSLNIAVESMEYYEGKLIVTGHSQFIYDQNETTLVCYCGDKRYVLKDTERFSEYALFGEKIFRYPTFRLEIPGEEVRAARGLSFHLKANSGLTDVRMNVAFTRVLAKLSTLKHSYWYDRNLGRIIKYRGKVIWVTPGGVVRHVYNEARLLWNLLQNVDNEFARQALGLRVLYYLTKPFYGQPIWMYSDKPYKAGDNGEYAYRYASGVEDGIKKYYVLNKKSADVQRFKREGVSFLPYGTLRHKLAFLNASIVFATHENQAPHNSIRGGVIGVRDLFNYNILFIQHGLTIQRLPRILNKSVDSTKKYFVASHFETENLLRPEYGYQKADIVTSGSPRYDGLKSDTKKQILITPTWRNYLAKPGEGKGEARKRNDVFRQSYYFKLYNSLINDKKILAAAEKYGYKIVFLLHPITSAQIDDFAGHDKRVEVIASTDGVSYEEMLTQSDLMVTDYSGVQFDFAYMKKPILYYQPKELPPSYEEAVYTYEKNSLGEILSVHDELVDRLCAYMKNGCKVPKKYRERMDSFFYHHDHSSAKRVYQEAIKFHEKLRRR